MQENIRIMAAGKPLVLPEDFSLNIEDVNPLFNDNVQSGSDPATLPLEGNRFLVKNLEDVNSDLRAVELEHTDMQIYIKGMPYRSGELVISEDQEISDSFDFSINSYTQALSDLISDLECWDVPVKDDIQIGECIGDVKPDFSFRSEAKILYQEYKNILDGRVEAYQFGELVETEWQGFDSTAYTERYIGVPLDMPAVGFSVPMVFREADANHINVATEGGIKIIEQDFINTHDAYPLKPYCNARVAYANYTLDEEGKTSDIVDANNPFKVLDARRPGSGICFYVLYFFDCLFKYLGLHFDNSNLLTVEDMKRLTFFTTHCQYDTVRKYPLQPGETERWDLNSMEEINQWLEQRQQDLVKTSQFKDPELADWRSIEAVAVYGVEGAGTAPALEGHPLPRNAYYEYGGGGRAGGDGEPRTTRSMSDLFTDGERTQRFRQNVNSVDGKDRHVESYEDYIYFQYQQWQSSPFFDENGVILTSTPEKTIYARIGCEIPVHQRYTQVMRTGEEYQVDTWTTRPITGIKVKGSSLTSGTMRANIMKMYANSKNFPQTSVKNIIDSMWASFGVKFVYNQEERKVIPYFIRDILRNTAAPRRIRGTVLSVEKVAEKVTGFRMQYAAESDPKEQSKNIRDGVRDYETAFDYIITQALNSAIVPDLDYEHIRKTRSISNTNCYIDIATGNAYRWKVDKEAKLEDEQGISLFEVASYRGITKGDCSKKNEDFIEEAISNFEPVIFTDVAANKGIPESVYAAYADVDMLNSQETFNINFVAGCTMAQLNLIAEVFTEETYDSNETEEMESPLQTYDWGNAIAVMRGGGADATIQYYDDNYDGYGNSRWNTVSGTYSMTSDTFDVWGNDYDYNASEEGMGTGERFSLKITAYKHDEQGNPLTDEQGRILCQDDWRDPETGEVTLKIRSRGLFDTFMSDYAHFLLNRKKLRIRMLCEVADLMDIPNHWGDRYQIGDYVGWINRLKSKITVATGLEEVEIELFAL